MNTPTITAEHIDAILKLYDELAVLGEAESEAVKAAQENGATVVSVTRTNGEVMEVSEKDLWKEVFHIGEVSEGYPVLKEKYPNVFQQSALHAQKLQELTAYTVTHLSVDPLRMSLGDIIRIVLGLIEYRTKEPAAVEPMRYG